MSEEHLRILLGLLGDPGIGIRVGHSEGRWILATGECSENTYEELVRHEDWNEFIRLCAECSDYVPGDT